MAKEKKVKYDAKARRKEFSKRQFEEMCKIQCTTTEIAAIFGVCRQTLYTWIQEEYGVDSYLTVYQQLKEGGKVSLRRTQFKQAEKNSTMAIWLGKQILGQEDVSRQKIEADVKSKVEADIRAEVRAEVEQEMNVYQEVISTNMVANIDLSNLSDEELENLEKLQSKLSKSTVDEVSDD